MWESSSDNSTPANYQLYELVQKGVSPVDLTEMKTYLGSPSASFDAMIQGLIDTCTEWGECYTSREFTDNQHKLFIDCFEDRISVRKNPIDVIDSVKYSVVTLYDTTVAAT